MDFGRNNMQGECKKSSLLVFIDEPQQFLYKSVEIEVRLDTFKKNSQSWTLLDTLGHSWTLCPFVISYLCSVKSIIV